MNHYEYAALLWAYLPYMIYAFVFLTLLPKSFGKIIKFASADYEANRHKYHRCYGPDLCCHSLADDECESKPVKQRKAVTRVYPKRQRAPAPPPTTTATTDGDGDGSNAMHIKRQVQASQIQTQVHVNQIAKMFENGGLGSRKINRVTPTTVLSEKNEYDSQQQQQQLINIMKFNDVLQEDIENSQNLFNGNYSQHNNNNNNNWSSESIATMRRNKRALPNTLSFAGTSATPSTASPAASSSPLSSSSPQHSRSPTPTSPVQLRSAPLNLKTSVEDIFAAIARKAERNSEQSEQFLYVGCNTLSPVTCIDDILSERRLSRPLSAYSISDLLMNEENMRIDECYVNALHCSLNESEA